jgi:hypothetical protein
MLGFRWPISPSSWRRTILSRRHNNNNNNNNNNYHNYGDNDEEDDAQAQRLLLVEPVAEQVRYVGFGIGGAGNIRR